MRNQWKPISFALGSLWLATLTTAVVVSLPDGMRSDALADQTNRTATSIDPGQGLNTAQDLSASFRTVAEAMRPSVVSISSKTTAKSVSNRLPPGLRSQLPPGFEDFFEERSRGSQQMPTREGQGSGVVVREDGYILTNNHVVEGADEVYVELSDDRRLPAEVVGTDPETDLAVLKIQAKGLRAIAFGDSDAIQVGDWVLAIGSPFGLDQTVTAGIISGKNRNRQIVNNGQGFEDFLQTDAAINPGNSGGPLVNLRGELVGINTAILSRSGASAGIGFAIPVSLARPVLTSIIEYGQVRRGFLGAQVRDVTPELVDEMGLKVKDGALIQGVLDKQPAANANLQPGDVVVSVDGKKVRSSSQLVNYIASRPPGASVSMVINRDGETLDKTVDLQERTSEAMAMFHGGSVLGAKLEPITPESAQRYGYAGMESGLIVVGVEDGGIAAESGLMAGDVIESAGGNAVQTVNELQVIIAEAKRQGIPLRLIIRRGNTRMIVPLQ
ncbi:Do family serine endopeptidase [Rhodopirellula sp. P2]|uniref:Do family serine endopeptidase n=1 Tax=Rhodopirellula sp. P2 TaxID=2127060 RepID=UPI002367ABA4|nr:Do family serine endopeptidase [Rhodopirellula sp. P2]WDQ16021.1 Do family serine endopeptidase [Rhodopirellula sp. P2]